MRTIDPRAATLVVLAAAGLAVGACQIVSGLDGYSETGSAAGAGGSSTSSATGSSVATSTGTSSGSAGTGGAPGCGSWLACGITGQVVQLQTNGNDLGWIAGELVSYIPVQNAAMQKP